MPRGARPSPQSNRTDRATPTVLPEAPGQEYGQVAAQAVAQQAIPAGGGQPAAPAAPSPAGGAPGAAPSMEAALAAHAQANPVPPPLDRPTERPNEPVTSGLPVGPGPGPESLGGLGALQRSNTLESSTLANLLQGLAQQPQASSAIQYLASRAQQGVL